MELNGSLRMVVVVEINFAASAEWIYDSIEPQPPLLFPVSSSMRIKMENLEQSKLKM